MIDGWTAAQVKAAEQPHIDAGEPLMQRASAGLAHEVERLLQARDRWPAPVVLLVGSGSNGGDALFAGAALADAGCAVTVVPTGTRLHEEGLAADRASGAVDGVLDVVAHRTSLAARRPVDDSGVLVARSIGNGAAPARRPASPESSTRPAHPGPASVIRRRIRPGRRGGRRGRAAGTMER